MPSVVKTLRPRHNSDGRRLLLVIAILHLMTFAPAAWCRPEDWGEGFKALQLRGANFQSQLDYALRWTRAEPHNPAAWAIVAANSDALGNYQQGADGWRHVAELSPTLVWPLENLANDYEHLGPAAEAVAIYEKLLAMPHDASYDARWKHRLTELALVEGDNPSLSSARSLPSGIPRAAAEFTARMRSKWRSDAILNIISVRPEGANFRTEFEFFSPAKNDGMAITVRGSGVSARGETDPERKRDPLPSNILDLIEAVSKARIWGMEGEVDRATLVCRPRCLPDGTGVVWSITSSGEKSGAAQNFEVPAFIMPRQEFQDLLRAAEHGDPPAQLAVARSYFEGLAGPPDAAQAALWCAKAASQGDPAAQHLLKKAHEFENQPLPSERSAQCQEHFVYSNVSHRCVSSAVVMSHEFDLATHPEIAPNR